MLFSVTYGMVQLAPDEAWVYPLEKKKPSSGGPIYVHNGVALSVRLREDHFRLKLVVARHHVTTYTHFAKRSTNRKKSRVPPCASSQGAKKNKLDPYTRPSDRNP